MRLLLATSNIHKAKELKLILSDRAGLDILTFQDIPKISLVHEDGRTFEENAVKKAVSYARQSGCLAVADDSGLCVDALGGAPGVHSARFAGDERNDLSNCEKLLKLLSGVPLKKRTAHFECHIAFAGKEGLIASVSGNVKGFIAEELKGKNGFGYDPLFLYPELNQTFAEISSDLKNRISHRAKALAAFKKVLSDYFDTQKKNLDI